MKVNSTRILLISVLGLCAAMLFAHSLLARNILVMTDQDCTDMGGTINGHKKVLLEGKKGTFTKVTMTKCLVEDVDDQARSASSTVSGMSSISTFSKIVDRAEMASVLDSEGDLTVFAPSNKAFNKVLDRTLKELLGNREAARAFVLRHVVVGKRLALDFAPLRGGVGLGQVMTGGDRVQRRMVLKSDRVVIGESAVVAADIEIKNGVLFVIDSVIFAE